MSLLLTYVYLHCSDYTHCIGSGDIRDTHSGCSLVNSDASNCVYPGYSSSIMRTYEE